MLRVPGRFISESAAALVALELDRSTHKSILSVAQDHRLVEPRSARTILEVTAVAASDTKGLPRSHF